MDENFISLDEITKILDGLGGILGELSSEHVCLIFFIVESCVKEQVLLFLLSPFLLFVLGRRLDSSGYDRVLQELIPGKVEVHKLLVGGD